MKKLILGATALALTAMPVMANAAPAGVNPAQALSVSPSTRAGTRGSHSNKLAGASTIPLLIGAAVIAGVAYLVVDHEDKNDSDSN